MKTRLIKQLLTAALAATLAFTSVAPAYAADNTNLEIDETALLPEDPEQNDETTDPVEESETKQQNQENTNNETVPANGENSDSEKNNQANPAVPEEGKENNDLQNENDEEQIQDTDGENTETADENNAVSAVININYELDGHELNAEDADKTAIEGVVGKEMTISLHEPSDTVDELITDASFAGWYTTADYSDNDFVKTDDTWTYTFTPDAEEVSLTLYARYNEEATLVGEPQAGEWIDITVESSGHGRFYYIDYDNEATNLTLYPDKGKVFYYNYLDFDARSMPIDPYKVGSGNFAIPEGGYRFEGLYTDSNHTQKLTLSEAPYNDIIKEVKWEDFPETLKEELAETGTCTLYAKFVPIVANIYKYTGCGDGNFYSDQTVSIGGTFPVISNPSVKPGYSINGWKYYDRSSRSYVAITPGVTTLELGEYKGEYEYYYNYGYNEGDNKYYVDVYADWTENSYTFNFHLNKGTEDLKTTKTYKGRQHNKTLDPSKGDLSNNSHFKADGFKGWKVGDKEFTVDQTIGDVMSYVDSQGITNVDLFALWDGAEDQTYTYVLKDSDAEDAKTITRTATTGQAITFSGKEFSRLGYALTGWTTEDGKTIKITDKPKNLAAAKGEAVLTAIWTPVDYTVNYYASDEKGATKVTAKYNIKDNAEVVLNTENEALKGKAAFDENEQGTLIGWTTVGEKTFSKEAKVQDLIEYANEQGVKSVNLYAQWNSLTYTVKFTTGLTAEEYAAENFTGSEYKTDNHKETVAKGETLVLSGKEYVREGWTLTGWTYGNTSVKATANLKDIAAPGNTVTLTAKWSPDKYAITYNLNGGSLTDKSIKTSVSYSKVDVSKAVTVTEKTPLLNYTKNGESFVINEDDPQVVRPGYEFAGWKENGTSYTYYGGDIYKKLTLVAEWEAAEYTVTFNAAGGTIRSYNINHELIYPDRIYVAFSITDSRSLNYYSNRTSYPGYKLKAWKGVVGGKVRTTVRQQL
ncbi:MAG: InlB B-repeat-containing protein [Butyrivibrio sp.]|nr:InlB B-repeat-containing protein [Butyrivibrio sp.]